MSDEVYFDNSAKKECKNHTRGPMGYIAWHEWADKMKKTHYNSQCPGCGLYLIWTPKQRTTKQGEK